MMQARQEFLDRCRWIVERFGETTTRFVRSGCVNDSTVRKYEDDAIEIIASPTTKAIDVSIKLPHHNPVIMVKEDGNPIRFHGEWTYAQDHVAKIGLLDQLAEASSPAPASPRS